MPKLWQTRRERRDAGAARTRRAELIADYRTVFSTPSGQRVLADICRRTGVMQSSFTGDGAEATAYREGRRRAALEIIETINSDPETLARVAMDGDTEGLFTDEF